MSKAERWGVKNVRVEPNTWKAIASGFVMAVADVARSLRSIAAAIEAKEKQP